MKKTIRYRILNVFAEHAFGGNPLAVVEDGSQLSDEEMQALALQFNYSETTFILPSENAAARIRIFTPVYEMPFAGHPTLGSAAVISHLKQAGDDFAIDMQAGIIPVQGQNGMWTLSARYHNHAVLEVAQNDLAAMLNLDVAAIAGPATKVSCGNEQIMLPLRHPDEVRRAQANPELLTRFCSNNLGRPKVYVFAPINEHEYIARFFWSPDGKTIGEDPGTGSAAANLGAWWQLNYPGTSVKLRIHQGEATGRQNVLHLDVSPHHIKVGGNVIELGRGEMSW